MWVDPFGLTQCRQTARRGWRCTGGPGSGGRVGVIGCIGGCASYVQGDSNAKASIAPMVGAALMVCSSKKEEPQECTNEPKKDCGPYDPNCDNSASFTPSYTPKGAGLGIAVNADGSTCVVVGPFVSPALAPVSIDLGDINE